MLEGMNTRRGLAVLAVLVVAACGGNAEPDAPPADASAPAEAAAASPEALVGEWQLVVIDMADGEDLTPVADAVPTIMLSAEATPTGSRSFSGFGGCNRMMGSYDAGSTGRFSMAQPPAMTMMACPDPIMRVEQVLGLGLESARTWSLEEDVLEIGFGGGILRLQRAPSP